MYFLKRKKRHNLTSFAGLRFVLNFSEKHQRLCAAVKVSRSQRFSRSAQGGCPAISTSPAWHKYLRPPHVHLYPVRLLVSCVLGAGKMLLDEKEADAEAHEGEKEALWRRIQVRDDRGCGEAGERAFRLLFFFFLWHSSRGVSMQQGRFFVSRPCRFRCRLVGLRFVGKSMNIC